MFENRNDQTKTFSISQLKELETKQTLRQVYDALVEKGYNPINQIVGYILSEDPTYITSYNNARGLIRKLDRDELMKILVNSYLRND
ncbi:MAG: IreB family regulatory phosphoprotein [Ruminococcaceae bacterium]|nr:IreB family regulatory phosphoprotein [Oscillospiraceae bacterium]